MSLFEQSISEKDSELLKQEENMFQLTEEISQLKEKQTELEGMADKVQEL